MMKMCRWWPAVAAMLLTLSGCPNQIDDQLQRVDEEALKNWKLAKVVLDKGMTAYKQTEQSRSTYEAKEIDRRFDDWLNTHTGADGRLYATTQPTTQPAAPLLREDILKVVKQRDVLLVEAAKNRDLALAEIDAIREVVIRYDVMVETITNDKASILEKRKATAAVFKSITDAIVGAGGGASITALLMAL